MQRSEEASPQLPYRSLSPRHDLRDPHCLHYPHPHDLDCLALPYDLEVHS
ncbi:hypothetical protein OG302_40800 [Streptomyces sp. NBC_01283]|nr:hypothetical protein OG302_40800 [Streptomyces sp. NBC_01283]